MATSPEGSPVGTSRAWQAPKLTNLGQLDSHTGAAQVSTDDGPSGSGSLGGDSDSTS